MFPSVTDDVKPSKLWKFKRTKATHALLIDVAFLGILMVEVVARFDVMRIF